jgi:hypothetical protein
MADALGKFGGRIMTGQAFSEMVAIACSVARAAK